MKLANNMSHLPGQEAWDNDEAVYSVRDLPGYEDAVEAEVESMIELPLTVARYLADSLGESADVSLLANLISATAKNATAENHYRAFAQFMHCLREAMKPAAEEAVEERAG